MNKQIKIIIERQKENLSKRLDDSKLNNDERELLKHELEMLEQFGIYGISSATSLFSIGDTIKLTLDYGKEIHEFEGKLLLFHDSFNTYIETGTDKLVQIYNGWIVKQELIEPSSNKLYKSLVEGNKKFRHMYENGCGHNYG